MSVTPSRIPQVIDNGAGNRGGRVKITIFSEEAHNDAVERQIATEQSENAKLRELCWELFEAERIGTTSDYWHELCGRARELGIEVDE